MSVQLRIRPWKLFSLAAMLLAGCASEIVVTRITPPPTGQPFSQDGVFYTLPRTVIRVNVPITREQREPGRFKDLALCYFPGSTPVLASGKAISIQAPQFSTRGEPDPNEVFMVKITGRRLEKKALTIELTEAGLMTKGEAESQNQGLEFAGKALRTVASIAASPVLGFFGNLLPPAGSPEQKIENTRIACINALTSTSDEVKAEAQIIFGKLNALQSDRQTILSATNFTQLASPEALQGQLREVDKQIQTYLDMFLGSTTKSEWIGQFDFTPSTQQPPTFNNLHQDLFDFSSSEGICSFRIMPANRPPMPFLTSACPNATAVSLKLDGIPGRQPADEIAPLLQTPATGKQGFFFRIPRMARARLVVGADRPENDRGQADLQIAQFGATASLPATTNGRQTKYTLTLYDASGSLKTLTVGSDALITQTILDDINAAATSLLDAEDELKQLERERKILEERKKLLDAQKALEDATETEPPTP